MTLSPACDQNNRNWENPSCGVVMTSTPDTRGFIQWEVRVQFWETCFGFRVAHPPAACHLITPAWGGSVLIYSHLSPQPLSHALPGHRENGPPTLEGYQLTVHPRCQPRGQRKGLCSRDGKLGGGDAEQEIFYSDGSSVLHIQKRSRYYKDGENTTLPMVWSPSG